MFLAAVVQICSTSDADANRRTTTDLIEQAAKRGARLVCTPENTNLIAPLPEMAQRAEPLEGPTCTHFAELARRLDVYLLLGSFNEKSEQPDHCYNTSVLFGPDGGRLALYRKIHLFDVDAPGRVKMRESSCFLPGREVVVADTPLARLGLSICYDLRFGELFRRLTDLGAEVLCIPAAFTLATGRYHWQTLLQGRAIEFQSYVVAPAQWGRHDPEGRRESYGHAQIIDPWGQVLAMVPDGPGIAVAEINPRRVAEVRQAIPVRQNRRL
jgi:predicted amidohydrolase